MVNYLGVQTHHRHMRSESAAGIKRKLSMTVIDSGAQRKSHIEILSRGVA